MMELVTHLAQSAVAMLICLAPLSLAVALSDDDEYGGSCAERWLSIAVYCVAAHIALALALGSLHLFQYPGVVAGELTLAIVGGLLLRRGVSTQSLLPGVPLNSAHAGFLFLILCAALVLAWRVVLEPTTNYDSFAYHLPAMAWWYQSGGFELHADLQHAAYYAYGWELLSMLFVFPMHEDLYIALPNVFAWLLLGLAVFTLARSNGARRSQALAAAALLLSMPTFLTRVDATQPDIALAAFFIAGIYFGQAALRNKSPRSAGLCLLCLFMLPGLKMSGLVYAPSAMIIVLLPKLVVARSLGRGWREALPLKFMLHRRVILHAILGLFVGAFWYARNLLIAGNPFGFLEVDIAGVIHLDAELTRAELQKTALSNVFRFGEAADWKVLWQVLRQWLSYAFAAQLVLAALAIYRGIRGQSSPSREALSLLLIGIGLTAFAYWTAPYSGDNGSHDYRVTAWMNVGLRYGYPLLALIAVLASLGFEALRMRGIAALALPALSMLYGLLFTLKTPGSSLRWAVFIAFVLAAVALEARRRPAWLRPALAAALIFLLSFSGLAMLSSGLREGREVDRVRSYGRLHEWLEASLGDDVIIGYVRTHRRYQLFGQRWKRRVVDVSVTRDNAGAWALRLYELGINYVAVGSADANSSQRKGQIDVRPWLEDTRYYELVFEPQNSSKDLAIYRVKR